MSDYGKLWEQRRGLRERLKRHIALLDDYASLADAKAHVRAHKVILDRLIAEWEDLEKRMAAEPE